LILATQETQSVCKSSGIFLVNKITIMYAINFDKPVPTVVSVRRAFLMDITINAP
jgi:hypothetical protein